MGARAVYVVSGPTGDGFRAASDRPGGWMNANMRTTFLKIVRRAGLQPWPRLFHNLRASCETDLMKTNPIHCVCSWLGNTPTVALRHYLQVLETDFEQAAGGGAKSGAVVVQKAVQSGAGGSGLETTEATKTLPEKGFRRLVSAAVASRPLSLMGDAGFEPAISSV